LVSGSGRHRPVRSQAEGASAIHSAADTSGAAIRSFFVNSVCLVMLRNRIETVLPVTVTLAEIVSPARIFNLMGTGAAGTSSYHAPWRATFDALQFASVPICSSACDSWEKPPRPIQNAENVLDPVVQLATGSLQLPVTFVNEVAAVAVVGAETA